MGGACRHCLHRQRRTARLRVGAGASRHGGRRLVMPDNARRYAIGNHNAWGLGRIERGIGLGRATGRTGAVMCASVVVAMRRKALLTAMAERRRAQGIAGRNRRRKRRANGCEDLHHQRDQDNRQEFLKASTHAYAQGHLEDILNQQPRGSAARCQRLQISCRCGFSDEWRRRRFRCIPLRYYNTSIRWS